MKVTVAATQMACSWDREANVANAEKLIRAAAGRGANIVLIQIVLVCRYWSIASVPLSRASEPERR